MARVVISTSSFGRYDPRPLELLAAAGHEVRTNPHGRRMTTDESRDFLGPAVGLIAGTEELSREVLAAAPRLRVISRCGVGLDGIDLAAAAEHGILVARTTDAHVDAVAELALGGILDVLRRISAADRGLRAGGWDKPMGRLLRGKTVGVVGLGRTGRRLVELLAPFDVAVLASDPVEDRTFADAHGVTYGSLDTVLENADIVTLHLEHSVATHHLLDATRIAAMRPGAILVNGARGGLVDEEALAADLAAGHLGGAFLDVFEREPYEGPLAGLETVVLTPHIGSYAVEGRVAMELAAVENLLRALEEGGA
ncbi:MAG: phosphoglycerate dehydrogenase [Acidobacteriota bacterium]|nr:phosphoglycerate dehydrogenase [Acidobacteriota bacterium]MDH3524669.1 phosphoglycerate dehydrogenase [Acidobacteriota bacterium]